MSCEHTQRCTGHCCRRFYLRVTPEEIRADAELARAGKTTRFSAEEIVKIDEMIIPLEDAKDAKEDIDGGPPPTDGHYYTCKHHDPVTGNCMNYENRPKLCRDYPFYGSGYRNRCRYKDCTWEDARNPLVSADRLRPARTVAEAA